MLERSKSLIARQHASQRAFFRALATASDGAALLDLPGGVQATAAPVRPWYSIFNSVVFEDAGLLIGQLDQLAGFYREAGSLAWALWVPPCERGLDESLTAAGLQVDSTPMLMAASVGDVDLEPRMALDLAQSASAQQVARVNDQAHGVLPEWSMTAVFEHPDDQAIRPYVALIDGEPACALLAVETNGDCYFWFVATAPEARGRGLAAELLRHALRQAAVRGCTTTTLESTAMAESLYERLGYQSFGRYRMWEHRAA